MLASTVFSGAIAPRNSGKPGSTTASGRFQLPPTNKCVGGASPPTSATVIAIGSGSDLSESNSASRFFSSASFFASCRESFLAIASSLKARSSRHWTMRAICSSNGRALARRLYVAGHNRRLVLFQIEFVEIFAHGLQDFQNLTA